MARPKTNNSQTVTSIRGLPPKLLQGVEILALRFSIQRKTQVTRASILTEAWTNYVIHLRDAGEIGDRYAAALLEGIQP